MRATLRAAVSELVSGRDSSRPTTWVMAWVVEWVVEWVMTGVGEISLLMSGRRRRGRALSPAVLGRMLWMWLIMHPRHDDGQPAVQLLLAATQ